MVARPLSLPEFIMLNSMNWFVPVTEAPRILAPRKSLLVERCPHISRDCARGNMGIARMTDRMDTGPEVEGALYKAAAVWQLVANNSSGSALQNSNNDNWIIWSATRGQRCHCHDANDVVACV